MKTIFTQQEIQQALVNFMELQGIVIKDRNINVTFTKGRKADSLEAVVDVEDPSNIFAGKAVEPVKEEAAVNAPQETAQESVKPQEPEEPPFTPDAPKEPEAEPQTGSSAPSSDPLPKTLFQRD